MSTRCLIGKVINNSGRCKVIYCHNDGYVQGGVGDTLINHYRDPKKIDKLIQLGDISSLGEIPESDPKQWIWQERDDKKCVAYRDRGEHVPAKLYRSPGEVIKLNEHEYNYFFIDDKWYLYRKGKIIDLDEMQEITKED